MISSPWLLLALFLAIAAGFFLGRMETRRRRRLRRGPRGLPTFLSRDTTTSPRDHALEALLSSTDTDPDTVDTHLAMGRLFRKRGELERATRLHQRMADNPELPETVREDAALELARDYLSAGLLDRAEALLQHMVDHGNRHAPLAMRQLMMLFEQERDWHSALNTGERLLRRDASVAPVLAQKVKDALGYKYHWAVPDYLQRSGRHLASATDLEQAYAVGRAAVEMAEAGKNAVMPAIIRGNGKRYSWSIQEAPLAKVANVEKMMPRNFITRDGFGITEAARDYLLPLIQGEADTPFRNGMPVHARLKAVPVPKKLKGKFEI